MRRRMGMRSRVRRTRTKVVNAVFDSESVKAAILQAGGTTFVGTGAGGGTPLTYTSLLPAFAGGQALNYQFISNLQQCSAVCPSYSTIAALYDWFKLKKVTYTFSVPIDPKRDMTISLGTASTAYDFTGALAYDPDMTLVDYDGVVLPTAAPTNGDVTQIIYNRTGVRKHKAFRTIRRTFYPRLLSMHPLVGQNNGTQSTSPAYPNNAVITGGTLNVATVATSYRKGPKYGWMRSSTDGSFTGALCLFASYKGPNASSSAGGLQPAYNWSVQSKWFVSYRDTIYG